MFVCCGFGLSTILSISLLAFSLSSCVPLIVIVCVSSGFMVGVMCILTLCVHPMVWCLLSSFGLLGWAAIANLLVGQRMAICSPSWSHYLHAVQAGYACMHAELK